MKNFLSIYLPFSIGIACWIAFMCLPYSDLSKDDMFTSSLLLIANGMLCIIVTLLSVNEYHHEQYKKRIARSHETLVEEVSSLYRVLNEFKVEQQLIANLTTTLAEHIVRQGQKETEVKPVRKPRKSPASPKKEA